MTAPMKALMAEGDRWLDEAVATYRGGGESAGAAACAAIASAHYARAELERPDGLSTLIAAGAAHRAAAEEQGDRAAAKASGRHPAGRGRNPTTMPEET